MFIYYLVYIQLFILIYIYICSIVVYILIYLKHIFIIYILCVVLDINYVNTVFCLNSLLLKICVGQLNKPILMVSTIVAFG